MTSEPAITLYSSDLLSKWGFNDGDEPDIWLDYLDEMGLDWDDIPWPLVPLVRRYLLPALAAHHDIEVYEIESIHNPIRARRVNGIEIDDHAVEPQVQLTPEWVNVPLADALRIAQEGRRHD
ncbi:hypothetical protein CDO52_00805 [Nocardiopsis gilva YIM 90087]|uniref:Uncharacterized protein n=1 Tax=Nocardiopsis gilva YIM 90087 TaxID=1235441 RepID=A0A223S090_9ACTN|nr:hypothetical protein [Nocardiopsis gilva]ASU81518.1 hypothetical protein CDO52_00805 [Nocardiopsis gilva YIM 90087]